MLLKLMRIGEAFQQSNPVASFTQKPGTAKKWYALAVSSLDKDNWSIDVGDAYLQDQYEKFLYINQTGNFVTSRSPSMILTGKEKIKKDGKVAQDDIERLEKILKFLDSTPFCSLFRSHQGEFGEQLQSFSSNERKGSLLTIRVDGKFPYEIPEIRERFFHGVQDPNNTEHNKGICFLCNKPGNSSLRLSDVAAFATLDKMGFIPFLSEKNAWKSFTVCNTCYLHLKQGRQVVDNELHTRIAGLDLWILPESPASKLKGVIERIISRGIKDGIELKDYAQKEERVNKILAEENIFYDFIFVKKSQNAEKILLHVTEVSPTRLKQMADCIDTIRNQKLFFRGYPPSILTLSQIYGKPRKGQSKSYNHFLALINSIYTSGKTDYDIFLMNLMEYVRVAFRDPEQRSNFIPRIHTAGFAYAYLQQLGVIPGGSHMDTVTDPLKQSILDTPWKKGVFYEGVLTGRILEVQRQKTDNPPFLKKLKGLKMDRSDFIGLLPELVNKFYQYRAYDEEVAKVHNYAASSFEKAFEWKASIHEMNFIFSLGLGLYLRYYPSLREITKEEKHD